MNDLLKKEKSSTMADAKQGKPPTEDFYNNSSQSRVVLAKPRLGGFGSSNFGSSSNKPSNSIGSVLRPPQLKPTINPFLAPADTTDNDESKKDKEQTEKPKETTENEVPKFVPLGTSNVTSRTANPVPTPAQPTTSTSTASTGFVFGQNLSERVFMNEGVNNGDSTPKEHSSSNGTTELLFTSAAASVKENNQDEAANENSTSGGSGGSGLAAAAAEYERSHARPPPPAATYSHTGEEDETNVLQITCRLFAWEGGSWRERGRGVVRVNECAGGGARLVVRIAGSLRVMLNTKLWPDMVVQRAGTKSLRITAADAHQQIKLFLIMGAPQDIVHLHRALITRVEFSKRSAPVNCSKSSSQQAAERLEAAAGDEPAPPPGDRADRLAAHSPHKTEEYESNVDGMQQDKDDNPLKRKEPADEEISPKRQCPDIVTE